MSLGKPHPKAHLGSLRTLNVHSTRPLSGTSVPKLSLSETADPHMVQSHPLAGVPADLSLEGTFLLGDCPFGSQSSCWPGFRGRLPSLHSAELATPPPARLHKPLTRPRSCSLYICCLLLPHIFLDFFRVLSALH